MAEKFVWNPGVSAANKVALQHWIHSWEAKDLPGLIPVKYGEGGGLSFADYQKNQALRIAEKKKSDAALLKFGHYEHFTTGTSKVFNVVAIAAGTAIAGAGVASALSGGASSAAASVGASEQALATAETATSGGSIFGSIGVTTKGLIAGAGGLESILGKAGQKLASGGKLGFQDILSTLDGEGSDLPDWLQQGIGIYEQLSNKGGDTPAPPPRGPADIAGNVASYGKWVAIGLGAVVILALAMSVRRR